MLVRSHRRIEPPSRNHDRRLDQMRRQLRPCWWDLLVSWYVCEPDRIDCKLSFRIDTHAQEVLVIADAQPGEGLVPVPPTKRKAGEQIEAHHRRSDNAAKDSNQPDKDKARIDE